jgi:adenosine kinase
LRVIVTGSVATDYLMAFPGRFSEQLAGATPVSLSFAVDDLRIRRGGAGANIAYGLGQLLVRPVLVASAGADFAGYRRWLESAGVDTGSVLVSEDAHTARFLCTTDRDGNQLAAFYAGAMTRARDIPLAPVVRRLGGVDLVMIAPNDLPAMLRYTRDCRAAGYPFAADPSQWLANTDDGAAVRELVEGATWLFGNDYERELLLTTTGWSAEDVLARVGTWVTTSGDKGVRIESRGAAAVEVQAVPVAAVEPTGAGDAFRAGFVAGVGAGLTVVRAAQLGCVTASFAVESDGPQSYTIALTALLSRLGATYGRDAEIDLAARIRTVHRNSGPT